MSVKIFSSKVIAAILVLGVISILIYSGPAQAFVLSLQIPDTIVNQGDKIKVNINVNPEEGDNSSDVSYLIFKLTKLNGPDNAECKFLRDGSIVSGCDGIEIDKISTDDCEDGSYGYGYGYGSKCSLKYKITINSNLFEVGTYATSLTINAKGKDTTEAGDNIIINLPNKVCSVRARDGLIQVDEKEFTKNKINFYLPFNNADRGEGYLTGQDGKGRFTFRFKVDKMLYYTNDLIKAQVSGKFRIGNQGNYTDETAVLTFDRVQNTTSLIGNNVHMTGMKIYFRRYC